MGTYIGVVRSRACFPRARISPRLLLPTTIEGGGLSTPQRLFPTSSLFHKLRLLSLCVPHPCSTANPSSPPMAATDAVAAVDDAVKHGFERPEMYTESLANTAGEYDRHLFLCYKTYESWPSRLENSDSDPLPKLFESTLRARKNDIKVKTKLTICGGCDGAKCSDGDVLVFPEMVKYRGLKESDVEGFVDDVLVNGKPWASGEQEPLAGAYVFVCAHTNRDMRCGVCGPILIDEFKKEIESRDLVDQISVNSCSHIGGHKYAGNVIIFGTSAEGKVTGDWFGYVTPGDVPELIDSYIGRGEINEKLWRGQMGLYVEKADKSGKKEKHEKKEKKEKKQEKKQEETKTETIDENSFSCCQGVNGVSCCRDETPATNGEVAAYSDAPTKKESKCMPAWVGKWEQSDILMAGAVVGAVATVAVAYSFYRRSG